MARINTSTLKTNISNALETINLGSDKNLAKVLIAELKNPRISVEKKQEAADLILGKNTLKERAIEAGFNENSLKIIRSGYQEGLMHRVVNADSELKEDLRIIHSAGAAEQESLKKDRISKDLTKFAQEIEWQEGVVNLHKSFEKLEKHLEIYLPSKKNDSGAQDSPLQSLVKETLSLLKEEKQKIDNQSLSSSMGFADNKHNGEMLLIISEQSDKITNLPVSSPDSEDISSAKANIRAALMEKYKVPESHIPNIFKEKSELNTHLNQAHRKPPTLLERMALPVLMTGSMTASIIGGQKLAEISTPVNPNEISNTPAQTRVIPLKGKEAPDFLTQLSIPPKESNPAEFLGVKTNFDLPLTNQIIPNPASEFIKNSNPFKSLDPALQTTTKDWLNKIGEEQKQSQFNILPYQFNQAPVESEKKK